MMGKATRPEKQWLSTDYDDVMEENLDELKKQAELNRLKAEIEKKT